MTRRRSTQVLADVNAALVREHHVTDVLAHLLHDTIDTLDADAAGLLVTNDKGDLELLTATSHHVEVLEIFQSRSGRGPCIDCVQNGEVERAEGEQAITDRWPVVGPMIINAGFRMVHAQPMHWHDEALGGLNIFRRRPQAFDGEEVSFVQGVADAAMLTLQQAPDTKLGDVTGRIGEALHGRIVIEQAKGVLAHQLDVDMATAYQELLRIAAEDHRGLAATAERVIGEASPPGPQA